MSVPYVVEPDEKGNERHYDLFSRLLKDRIIFLRGELGENSADVIVGQLLFLETMDPDKDIFMYINSPGGHISDMYAIYDTMNYIKPDVVTVGIGTVMSAGSFLLAAGAKGKRFALPNTDIMIHELSSGFQGKFNDMKNRHQHIENLHERMIKHFSDMTGQPVKKLKKDMEKDYYMSSQQALDYGIIDGIQDKRG
jgi:ATP-dependent Clp protease protease subunit